MLRTVALPYWLFAILLILASWAALSLIIWPLIRWFYRRRINMAIARVNQRLNIELPSFKLTRRQVLLDRLIYDPRVQTAAKAYIETSGTAPEAINRRIERYAKEIVPSFDAYLYFRIGYAAARTLAKLLYRVRVGFVDDAALSKVDPRSAVVFVINHRSNMDYVLVAFLAAERAAISYAVGEWARVWPLQQLLRAMGAYFVRRDSRDALYRAVLARYVQMATEGGVTQAMFPEGGLTLDGKLRPPKFGLLDYMLKGFDARGERDLVFIPVGLNYDRVLEDRTQLLKLNPARRMPGALRALANLSRFVARNLRLMVRGRWHRFGYACVNFGTPISMREYARERGIDFLRLDEQARHAEVAHLAERVMDAIGRVIPVLPVSLVASVLMRDPTRHYSEFELKAAAHARLRELEAAGAHLYIPRQDHDYAFSAGLRMLTLRHLVHVEDELYGASPDALDVLAYYANAIEHLKAQREQRGQTPPRIR
jgi:glycerol-3-phosphate O-acyltransferase